MPTVLSKFALVTGVAAAACGITLILYLSHKRRNEKIKNQRRRRKGRRCFENMPSSNKVNPNEEFVPALKCRLEIVKKIPKQFNNTTSIVLSDESANIDKAPYDPYFFIDYDFPSEEEIIDIQSELFLQRHDKQIQTLVSADDISDSKTDVSTSDSQTDFSLDTNVPSGSDQGQEDSADAAIDQVCQEEQQDEKADTDMEHVAHVADLAEEHQNNPNPTLEELVRIEFPEFQALLDAQPDFSHHEVEYISLITSHDYSQIAGRGIELEKPAADNIPAENHPRKRIQLGDIISHNTSITLVEIIRWGTFNGRSVIIHYISPNRRHRGSTTAIRECHNDLMFTKKLNNPYLLNTLCGWVEEKSTVAMVKEMYESDLMELFSENSLNERDLKFVARCLGKALFYLHDRSILHGSIEMKSLFLKDNGKIGLGNFRHAINIPKKDRYGNRGNKHYAAPEVERDEAYDLKADMWSFGILLYMLHYRKFPISIKLFGNSDYEGLTIPTLSTVADPMQDFRDLLTGLLRVKPNERLDIDGLQTHKWIRQGPCEEDVSHLLCYLRKIRRDKPMSLRRRRNRPNARYYSPQTIFNTSS